MRQRICPVCGHLEEASTEYCTECGARTIEYDEGAAERELEPTRTAVRGGRRTYDDDAPEREPWQEEAWEDGEEGFPEEEDGDGGRRLPLGWIGAAAVLAIAILVILNKGILNRGDGDSAEAMAGSGPSQSMAADGPGADEGDAPGDSIAADGSSGEDGTGTEPSEGEIPEEGVNRYEMIVADVTWTQAYYDCLERGGHLVRITTDEEYQAILQQIADEGKEQIIFWLGGARNDESGYHWIYEGGYFGSEVLDEEEKYASYWLENEPSFHDAAAGVDETRMNMFRLSSSGKWVWNDVPDDILSVADFYSGKIGYICEYE